MHMSTYRYHHMRMVPKHYFAVIQMQNEEWAAKAVLFLMVFFTLLLPSSSSVSYWYSPWLRSESTLLHSQETCMNAIHFPTRRFLDLYSDRNKDDLASVVEAKCYVAQTSSHLTSKEGQVVFILLLISATCNACWGRVCAWLFPCVINQCWCSIETDEKCAVRVVLEAMTFSSVCSVEHVDLHHIHAALKKAVWDVTTCPCAW